MTHPRNLILGYIRARDLRIYVCAHYEAAYLVETTTIATASLGGPMSDKSAAMMGSPHLTTRLLAEPARRLASTDDAGSTAELQPREGRTGELQGGGPCQGPCLPLYGVLRLPHPCIIVHVKNAGILFTSVKIYTREKSIDAVSKMQKFYTAKIRTLMVDNIKNDTEMIERGWHVLNPKILNLLALNQITNP